MRGIDGDRLLREIRKHKNRVIVGCKTKYFPLDLIRKIIREAPKIRICEKKGNTNADRLRSMTDEEPEDQLVLEVDKMAPCKMFIAIPTGEMFISRQAAKEAVGKWLKQPAEEGRP